MRPDEDWVETSKLWNEELDTIRGETYDYHGNPQGRTS